MISSCIESQILTNMDSFLLDFCFWLVGTMTPCEMYSDECFSVALGFIKLHHTCMMYSKSGGLEDSTHSSEFTGIWIDLLSFMMLTLVCGYYVLWRCADYWEQDVPVDTVQHTKYSTFCLISLINYCLVLVFDIPFINMLLLLRILEVLSHKALFFFCSQCGFNGSWCTWLDRWAEMSSFCRCLHKHGYVHLWLHRTSWNLIPVWNLFKRFRYLYTWETSTNHNAFHVCSCWMHYDKQSLIWILCIMMLASGHNKSLNDN